jgi:hypothetical protein
MVPWNVLHLVVLCNNELSMISSCRIACAENLKPTKLTFYTIYSIKRDFVET